VKHNNFTAFFILFFNSYKTLRYIVRNMSGLTIYRKTLLLKKEKEKTPTGKPIGVLAKRISSQASQHVLGKASSRSLCDE